MRNGRPRAAVGVGCVLDWGSACQAAHHGVLRNGVLRNWVLRNWVLRNELTAPVSHSPE